MTPDGLTITHHVMGQGGKYVAHLDGEQASGYLEWEPAPDQRGGEVRIATHTVVPRAIGNRGVGAALVRRLVSDARQQGFSILPQCSFVAAMFERNPDWADLRA